MFTFLPVSKALYLQINLKFSDNVCTSILYILSYSERKVEIPLISLTPPHCCACLKPGSSHMSWSFLCSVSSVMMRGDCLFC